MLKFKKHTYSGKYYWDAALDDGRYYRIIVTTSGLFALYLCNGLADNGITPLSMGAGELRQSYTISDAKAAAEKHYLKMRGEEKQRAVYEAKRTELLHNVRLPYRD